MDKISEISNQPDKTGKTIINLPVITHNYSFSFLLSTVHLFFCPLIFRIDGC